MAKNSSGLTLTAKIGVSQNSSWSQIVAASRNQMNTKLDYFEPMVINGKQIVVPPEEVRQEGSLHWDNCLVGHFVGHRPAFPVVRSFAKSLWSKAGLQEVIAQTNGFVFFKFSTADGMLSILDHGPWFIAGRFLVLKKWERNLDLTIEASVTKIPIWVLLYNVPVELWTPLGLSYIASAAGKPLFADSITLSRKRLSYARVCIEIEAGAQLIEEITLASGISEDPCSDTMKVKAVYQWIPAQCSHCKVFGHNFQSCASNPDLKQPASLEANTRVPPSQITNQSQGWRQVGRRGPRFAGSGISKAREVLGKPSTSYQVSTSNPFWALENINGQTVNGDGEARKDIEEPENGDGEARKNNEEPSVLTAIQSNTIVANGEGRVSLNTIQEAEENQQSAELEGILGCGQSSTDKNLTNCSQKAEDRKGKSPVGSGPFNVVSSTDKSFTRSSKVAVPGKGKDPEGSENINVEKHQSALVQKYAPLNGQGSVQKKVTTDSPHPVSFSLVHPNGSCNLSISESDSGKVKEPSGSNQGNMDSLKPVIDQVSAVVKNLGSGQQANMVSTTSPLQSPNCTSSLPAEPPSSKSSSPRPNRLASKVRMIDGVIPRILHRGDTLSGDGTDIIIEKRVGMEMQHQGLNAGLKGSVP